MGRLDAYLVAAAQAAYDWALDTFGLLVGHLRAAFLVVGTAAMLASQAAIGLPTRPIHYLLLCLTSLMVVVGARDLNRHAVTECDQQRRGQYQTLNRVAEMAEAAWFFRFAWVVFFATDLVSALAMRSHLLWVSTSLALYGYARCVRVRDREKREAREAAPSLT